MPLRLTTPAQLLQSGHPFHANRRQGHRRRRQRGDHRGELEGRQSVVCEVRPYADSDDPGARAAARWRAWLVTDEGERYSGREFGLRFAQMLEPTTRL
jgi:hypothetical protein